MKTQNHEPTPLPKLRAGDPDLRPITQADAPELFAIIDRDRDYLRRYQNWPDYMATLRDVRELIARADNRLQHDNGFDLVIRCDGAIAGKVGLVYINWDSRSTEIGYWLAESAQGQGLVTRSCKVLMRYAFAQRGLRRVLIRCAANNTRSRAVAERLGFTLAGKIEPKIWLHGKRTDESLYAMELRRWLRLHAET